MEKRLTLGFLLLLLCGGCVMAAETDVIGLQASYTVRAEGRADKEVRGVLMIPLRDTAEQMGFTVAWENGAAVVADDVVRTVVTPGSDLYALSSSREGAAWTSEPFSLGIPPALSGSTMYVPIDLFRPLLEMKGKVVAFEGRTITVSPAGTDEDNTGMIGMPNPFRDFSTLEEAEAFAGYGLTLPEISAEEIVYRAISGELLEVIYKNGGEEILRIRKGSTARDVSGDYNSYASIRTVRVGEISSRMRGEGETVNLVTWISGGHAYALSSALPRTVEEMSDLVSETN